MRVWVNRRKGLKREKYVSKIEYNFTDTPTTVKGLISYLVTDSVNNYNDKIEKGDIVKVLLKEEIDAQGLIGKVSFGGSYSDKDQDMDKALENAYQCYEDGLYRIFINDKEVGAIGDILSISEDDEITIIRLTMLAGRMW